MADHLYDEEAKVATPAGLDKPTAIHLESGQQAPGGHEVEFTGRQFGTIQWLDASGNHILQPQPSSSRDDPLNWSWGFKQYIAILACTAVLLSNITGPGPTVAIVQQSFEWWGPEQGIAKIQDTAYLFNGTAIANGVGLFFWVPAITKYGRRPMFILAMALYLACVIWCGVAKSFVSELLARIVLGLAAGAGECLGALVVTDIFFSHQRGLYMAWYNVLLACGAAAGLIIDGAIAQQLGSWRAFYYVDAGLIGAILLAVAFTFPETAFNRQQLILNGHTGANTDHEGKRMLDDTPRKSYVQRLALYNGKFTNESYFTMFLRPFGIIFLPAVLFGMLVFSATIGILVGVTSNAPAAYEQQYGFTVQQVGFLFFGALVASLIGVPAGGWLGDYCADWGAKRNNGVREPEHRLIAMAVPIAFAPLSTTLYGACIEHHWHWFVGCLGLSLVNFNICAATNIALVYAIDCYKPIADEVVTAILGWKAVFGFVIGFYMNNWVASQGYIGAYGQMAAVETGLLLLTIPIYIYGKRLRQSSANWRFLAWAVKWADDRDDLKIE